MPAPSVPFRDNYLVSTSPEMFRAEGDVADWMRTNDVASDVQERFLEKGTGVLNYCLDQLLKADEAHPDWDRFHITGGNEQVVFIATPTFQIPQTERDGYSSRLLFITDSDPKLRFRQYSTLGHLELVEDKPEYETSDNEASPQEAVIEGPVFNWTAGTEVHPITAMKFPDGSVDLMQPEAAPVVENPYANYLVKGVVAAHAQLCPPEADS